MKRLKIKDLDTECRFYIHANRKLKSKILDNFCQTFGYNRKYAIRLLGHYHLSSIKKPGPCVKYKPEELLTPLKRIWFATDQMCGKRLVAAIPLWLPYYSKRYSPLESRIEELLCKRSKICRLSND